MVPVSTRLEKVVLDIESNLAAVAVRDAQAIAILKRELNSLSGPALRGVSRGIDDIGGSADRSGKQIDRLSGRLVLLAQAAAVLGPVLAPTGAAGLGAIAGLTAELGAMAAAITVGVIAFKGLGDGMKALDAYQLEPTAENLEKVRLELERLGPAGAHFVMFLDSIEPQLKSIQLAARAGLFPGVEDGISSMLTMLPRLRDLTRDIAESMGELTSEAGAGLAGPAFREFFGYLKTDAAPTLESLGRTIGNFSTGFAQLLVEFAPVSRGFTTGLEDMSESFAEWAAGLDQNDSFQSFLAYIQESGPKVLDMLGSMIGAFASIAEAAAPVGDVILPALTSLFDIISMLAESPLGPMFFTAAAAMSVYSRAAAAAAAANISLANSSLLSWRQAKGLGVGIGAVALSLTDMDDQLGVSNTAMLGLAGTMAGPWGAAVGLAVGALLDLRAANADVTDELEGLQGAMSGSSPARLREEIAGVRDEMRNASGPTHGLAAAWDDFTGRTEKLSSAVEDAEAKLRLLDDAAGRTEGLDHLLGAPLDLARELDIASDSMEQFSQSFAALNDLLSRSSTLIAYEAALDDLTKSIKDNGNAWEAGTAKGRANLEARNRLVETAIDRSEALKKVGDNLGAQKILTRAISDLQRFGNDSPKAQAKVRELIAELRRLDGTEAKPKADVDNNPAKRKVDETNSWLLNLDKKRSESEVDADASSAFETFYRVNAFKIADKHMTIHVGVSGGGSVGIGSSGGGGGSASTGRIIAPGATGRLAPSSRMTPTVPPAPVGRMASVTSLLDAPTMRAASAMSTAAVAAADVEYGFDRMRNAAERELNQRRRLLEKELAHAEEKFQAERDYLRELKDAQRELAAAASGNFLSGLFGEVDMVQAAQNGLLGPDFMQQVESWLSSQVFDDGKPDGKLTDYIDDYLATLTPQQLQALQGNVTANTIAQDIRDANQFAALLQTLSGDLGFDGGMFQELAASGNIGAAEYYATLTAEQIDAMEQAYEERMAAADRVGAQAAQDLNDEVRKQRKLAEEARDARNEANRRLDRIEDRLEEIAKNTDDLDDRTGDKVGRVINGTVGTAQRSA